MSSRGDDGVGRLVGGLGCALGILVMPPVAERWLALDALQPADYGPLWGLSAGVLGLSLILILRPHTLRGRLAALAIPVFGLLAAELAVRLVVIRTEAPRARLAELANRTYPSRATFIPHPFLQFTGRSGAAQKDDDVDRGGGFNERGFLGPLLPQEKRENVVRIACLGGSTTARGYPFEMQRYLRDMVSMGEEPDLEIEVLNFGMVRYSSTHSLVNFVLNVVDFDPDYVVFHHAWNDHWARDRDGPIRGDGSHFMKEFSVPEIPDSFLIRASVIYRFLKDRASPSPAWTFLGSALVSSEARREGTPYRDLAELGPYERNVRTILDLALLRGMVPVLMTQPHSMDPSTPNIKIAKHIDQCNAIVRSLALEYGSRVPLVDLDGSVTGKHEEFFIDLGHMTPMGTTFKAHSVGDAILADLRGRRTE